MATSTRPINKIPETRQNKGIPSFFPVVNHATGLLEGYKVVSNEGVKVVAVHDPLAAQAPKFSPTGFRLPVVNRIPAPFDLDPVKDGFRKPNTHLNVKQVSQDVAVGKPVPINGVTPQTIAEFRRRTGSAFNPKNGIDLYNINEISQKREPISHKDWVAAGSPSATKPNVVVSTASKVVGGIGGGAAGAAIGTAVLPGVGTLAGRMAGTKLGELAGEEFAKDPDGFSKKAMRFSPLGSVGIALQDKLEEGKGKKKGNPILAAKLAQERMETKQDLGAYERARATASVELSHDVRKGVVNDTVKNVKDTPRDAVLGKIPDGDGVVDPVKGVAGYAGGVAGGTVGGAVATAALTPVLGPVAAPVGGILGGALGDAIGKRVGETVANEVQGTANNAPTVVEAKNKLDAQKRQEEEMERLAALDDFGPGM